MSQGGPSCGCGHAGEAVLPAPAQEAASWIWHQGLQLLRHQQGMGECFYMYMCIYHELCMCKYVVSDICVRKLWYSSMQFLAYLMLQLYIRRILISEGSSVLEDALKVGWLSDTSACIMVKFIPVGW